MKRDDEMTARELIAAELKELIAEREEVSMNRPIAEKEREFMERLTALTRELGVAVVGCGCCGSPSLMEVDVSAGTGYRANVAYGEVKDITWLSDEEVEEAKKTEHCQEEPREVFK